LLKHRTGNSFYQLMTCGSKPSRQNKAQKALPCTTQEQKLSARKGQHRSRCALERAPLAFNNLSTPGTSQFTMRFAVRCVLHRFLSQDIHRCKEYCFNSMVSIDLTNNLIWGRWGGRSLRTGPEGQSKPLRKQTFIPFFGCANDPSAGSPTETLLRLLLPLSDKVYETFRETQSE
jgi:hypothetical protein